MGYEYQLYKDILSLNDNYITVSNYSLLFESENDDIKEIIDGNNTISYKISNRINKLISMVKNAINNLISKVKNFFSYLGSSKEEKEKFKEFKELCKSDPSLKNKKISIIDYRKINAEYDKYIKEIDNKLHELRKDETTDIDKLVSDIKECLDKSFNAATILYTVDACEKLALSNQETAKSISNYLNNDLELMNKIEQEIGRKDAEKFKKTIDRAAKGSILIKMRTMLYKKKYNNLMDVNNEMTKGLNNIISGSPKAQDLINVYKINKNIKKNETLGSIYQDVKDGYKKGKKKIKEKEESNKEDENDE